MSWVARALVFSGRPDPTWPLSSDEQQQLLALWSRLPAADSGDATPPATLGYRGVEVGSDDGRSWLATGGLVTLTSGAEDATRLDPHHAFERFVVATAPQGVLPPGAGGPGTPSAPPDG